MVLAGFGNGNDYRFTPRWRKTASNLVFYARSTIAVISGGKQPDSQMWLREKVKQNLGGGLKVDSGSGPNQWPNR